MSWLELARAARGAKVAVLTGAGISAESGVPTFRGPEGYWRVGSRNWRPEELATLAAFERMPESIWGWYLHRRSVCLAAAPNAAHAALVGLERALGERFALITQNVDGLHLRAGHDPARVLQVHGNLHLMRCSAGCGPVVDAPPQPPGPWPKDRPLDAELRDRLRCRACGAWMRPHVLWFDECYDERHYRYDSALAQAASCELLLVVGTSGATSLPAAVVRTVAARGAALLVVNREPSPFGEVAEGSGHGCFVLGSAGEWVPRVCAELAGGAQRGRPQPNEAAPGPR